MFFQFLEALLSLDLAWFVWIVEHNIIWAFAFFAMCFFFWDGKMKKAGGATLLLIMTAWIWVDMESVSGLILFVGGFLSVYYITKVAVMTFAEDSPILRKHLVLVGEIQFVVVLLAYNIFMR